MTVNGRTVTVVSERNPLNLPWKEMGIDIVIESTGAPSLFLSSTTATLSVFRVSPCRARAHLDSQEPKRAPSQSSRALFASLSWLEGQPDLCRPPFGFEGDEGRREPRRKEHLQSVSYSTFLLLIDHVAC